MEIVRLATALAACASQSKRVAVEVEAKIEVLEEEDAHMVAFLGGTYTDENREWRQAKIEALLAKVAELEETLSHVPMGMRR